ncbi:MAG TPA: glycosyltransferase family 39 protein [Thermoanaerobaculaceae bacterium]|nr:glycosyltransferase family 39 protein [Thermoanaerobaculaceae bacterium]
MERVREQVGADPAGGAAGPRRRFPWRLLAVCLVFAAGTAVRLYRIGDPPFDFHPTRQYRSALLARWYYLENAPGVPAWRREVAEINARERYEFPLLQYVSALGYRLEGREDLRIPRTLSALAWLAGGAILLRLARRIAGLDGALVAASIYLLLPFGVAASRAFHPDALMVALLLLSYAALLAWAERGRLPRLLAAGAACGVAALVKPMAVFQVVAGFAAVWVARRRRGERATVAESALFLVVAAGVAAPYYAAQWVGARTLSGVADLSFIPHLLATVAFWQGWLAQIWKVLGFVAPAAAVLGWATLPRGNTRALLGGLAAGYAAFCLCFDYQAFTHDYYHLQLVPLVAVALAPLADRVVRVVRGGSIPLVGPVGFLAVVFVAAVLDLAVLSYYRERGGGPAAEVATYREVGELVGHGAANVLLANYYAYPLRYYGELGGTYWPLSFDARLSALMGRTSPSAAERLSAIVARSNARYFIATDLPELAAQPDLVHHLAATFALRASTDRYVIYDLRQPAAPGAR